MDDVQKCLMRMVSEHSTCIADRKQLKATLADYLPQNKLQQSLIISAFDADIVTELKTTTDATLHALKIVKKLSDVYGLTKNHAIWTVVSWCYMCGLYEVAGCITEATDSTHTSSSQPDSTRNNSSTIWNEIGFGTYAAGYNIPEGIITIRSNQIIKRGQARLWVIDGEKKNFISDFKDSVTVNVSKGQTIKLELVFSNSLNWPDYTFTVKGYD